MSHAVPVKFTLGRVVVTPRASELLGKFGQSPDDLLARHQAGDWGTITDQQRQINEEGLSASLNLVSAFPTPDGQCVHVFTSADRTSTLVHLGHGSA